MRAGHPSSTLRTGSAFGVGLLACLLLWLPQAPASEASDEALARLEAALDALEGAMSARPLLQQALIARMDDAADAWQALRPPAEPAAGSHEERLQRWRRDLARYERLAEAATERWIGLLEDVLGRVSIEGHMRMNRMQIANLHAIPWLVATEDPRAAEAIVDALDRIFRRDPVWLGMHAFATQALEAVPPLASPEAYEKLRRRHVGEWEPSIFLFDVVVGPRTRSVKTAGVLPLAHPALVAIARHEGMPGAARRRMVRDILRAYVELEERAAEERTPMDVARWDVIGEVAIHAAWRQAGEPTDAHGEPLRTLAQLDAWFRRNGSRRAEAWRD